MTHDSSSLLARLRARRPLVHCISGAVTAPFIADVLGALGAVPALTHDPAEAGALAVRAGALLVNLGQPDPLRIAGAREAARAARIAATPWVLDPVLAHASPRRRALAQELLRQRPAILKPNRAELRTLAGNDGDDGAAAVRLARHAGTVVLASGEVDIVSDGHDTTQVPGGHAFMDMMPGYGCALGAVAAALLTVAAPLPAALAAARTFAEAGRQATMRTAAPASFRIAFLDALHRLGEGA